MAVLAVTTALRHQDQLAAIRGVVAAGASPSVSGFVRHAVGVALDDVAGWGEMLTATLSATGEPTAEECRWADGVLGVTDKGEGAA